MARSTVNAAPLALACALLCGGAAAQIRTDGSVGAAASLQGPAYTIPQSLGRLAGANLFHSFAVFSVGSGETATFTTSSAGIANVIGRVTGGSASQIDGTLRLQAASGAPALYFINPAGIAFGPGAVVDVPGALHLATADYLKFADGRLYADPARASSFSSAPPEAFGFLGGSRATLAAQDGALLRARVAQPLTLAGGDILLDGATVVAGGELRLAAMGTAAGEVPFSGALPVAAGLLALRGGSLVATVAVGDTAGGGIAASAGDVLVNGDSSLQSLGATAPAERGTGGDIAVTAQGTFALAQGGNVTTGTAGAGAGGAIRVQAGQVLLDSEAYLYSSAALGATGAAGAIAVTAAGRLALAGGASISTAAYGAAPAGAIALRAADMALASGAYVQSEGTGGSSPLQVAVDGTLALAGASRIASVTSGDAAAGAVMLRAGSLQMAGGSTIGSLTSGAGASASVDVAVRGAAAVAGNSWILSSSSGRGDAGPVAVSAASLALDGSTIGSNTVGEASLARAGDIAVQVAGTLALANGSAIDTSTLTHGRAGNLQVRAADIVLDGASRLNSSALAGSGDAGALDVAASGSLVLRGESSLSTSSSTLGNAGEIRVRAGTVEMEGHAAIDSTAGIGSGGRGGNVSVTAEGALHMRDGARITAIAAGVGDAGSVQVQAERMALESSAYISTASNRGAVGDAGQVQLRASGDITLDGGAFVNSDAFGTGSAGDVSVAARKLTLTSGGRISSVSFSPVGQGGHITLRLAGELALLGGAGADDPAGSISTSTFGGGNGGAIGISAASVRLSGRNAAINAFAQPGSTGDAGSVDIQAGGLVSLSGQAGISTSTGSLGNGGAVRVRAGEVRIEDGAGIFSLARGGASGNAGSVAVQAAGSLLLRDGALSSSTYGTGAAGAVRAEAARVVLQGPQASISAAEAGGLSGRTGNVTVLASESIALTDGAGISIANAGVVADALARQPATLRLAAPRITLDHAVVSAAASGNVAASPVLIEAGSLALADSRISTEANAGDGGPITVQAGERVLLRRSAVSTSVLGASGNGGDIAVSTQALALQSGFIQANTAAPDAAGGLVRIAARGLVASGNSLLLGGDTPYAFQPLLPGFNVVQAAAPTGVSGVVQVTSPVLDVTGSLRGLTAQVIDTGGLGRSLCQASGGSALAQGGHGGLVPSARGFLRAEPAPAPLAARPGDPALAVLGRGPRAMAAEGCL